MIDFTGQAVIVTGAAGNLGQAIARRLALLGADLVLADVRAEPLEALAAELKRPIALAPGLDLRTADGCARLAEAATARFGRIDGLANTVGTFKTTDVAAGAASDWSFLMELNALSALRLSEAVLPTMRAQGYGRIVHTAAGAAQRSFAGASVYAASKAAVMRITEAIAEENKGYGVRANCVLPGTIDTPQNRASMPDADFSRWVSPTSIANAFAFLLSREAEGVNGTGLATVGPG